MTRALIVISLALGVGSSLGCGSDGGGTSGGATGESGVASSKTLASLTPAEKGKICDWNAQISGGYGKTMLCGDGTDVSNDVDQASCVADVPSCAATVAQFEACSKVVVTVPLCDQIAKLLGAAECAAIVACF